MAEGLGRRHSLGPQGRLGPFPQQPSPPLQQTQLAQGLIQAPLLQQFIAEQFPLRH